MATQNPGASNGLIALVGIVFGSIVTAIVTHAPLDSGRPQESRVPAPARQEALQHIDARLWEDPFAALDRHKQKVSAAAGGGSAAKGSPISTAVNVRTLCASIGDIKPTPGKLLLVPVMLSTAPYPDSGEQRMRIRYAVQSALAVAHFTPSDHEHLGHLLHDSMEMPFEIFKRKAGREVGAASPGAPYATEGKGDQAGGKKSKEPNKNLYALILWLGEEGLMLEQGGKVSPLLKIRKIARAIAAECGIGMETAILGPAQSDTLRAMIAEVDCGGKDGCNGKQMMRDYASIPEVESKVRDLSIYSPFATASGVDLLKLTDDPRKPCGQPWLPSDWKNELAVNPRRSGSLINTYFNACGINFFSTIATDQELGVVLARELRRRDPEGSGLASRKYHVALISESDTYYGRMLPKAVMRGVSEKLESDCEDDPTELADGANGKKSDKEPCTVLRFTYMRGLDGEVAWQDAGKRADAKADKRSQVEERAEGQQQFDYLRRLSQRIMTTDGYLRQWGRGWILSRVGRYADHQIRAIGILGVDVYDKISILRALRKDFPDAVFFTTDLDARLLHSKDIEWTRNLVVASSFGFSLADCVQKGIAPFRGVYQTSAYLSTRLALYNAFSGEPVGRGVRCPEDPSGQALFDEPGKNASVNTVKNGYVVGQDTIDVWLSKPRVFEVGLTQAWDLSRDASEAAMSGGVGDVHPPVPEFVPGRRVLILGATLLVLACAGLCFIPPVRRTLGWAGHFLQPVFSRNREVWRRRILVVALVLTVLAIEGLMLCAYLEADMHRGEPFAWFEGISIWPSELVRNLSLVLTYVFLFSACGRMNHSNTEILGWATPTGTPKLTTWQRLIGRMPDPRDATVSEGELLGAYAELSAARLCFYRSLLGTAVFWGIGILLMEQFGYPPLPVRGQYAAQLDQFLVFVLVPSFLILLFFVIDATRLCERFSNLLSVRSTVGLWNSQILDLPIQTGQGSNDLAPQVNDAWAMIRMVAIRTSAIGPMVYFPFVVLGFLVLARWTRFDNWGFSLGLVVILGASFVMACLAAALLQRTATRVRDRAVANLERCLLKRRGRDDKTEPTEKQIEQVINAARSLREGAFLPILEQPIVVASLFPFATAFMPKVGELLGLVN